VLLFGARLALFSYVPIKTILPLPRGAAVFHLLGKRMFFTAINVIITVEFNKKSSKSKTTRAFI